MPRVQDTNLNINRVVASDVNEIKRISEGIGQEISRKLGAPRMFSNIK